MTAPGKVALTTLSYMNIQGTQWDKDYAKSTIFLRVTTYHACKIFEVAFAIILQSRASKFWLLIHSNTCKYTYVCSVIAI